MNKYQVSIESLNPIEAEQIVRLGEYAFDKLLSEAMDIPKMANKWSHYAKFLMLKDEDNLAALIVFYENCEENFIYITHFVVMPDYRHIGMGHYALISLLECYSNKYNQIRLKVRKTNSIARAFYTREQFEILEELDEAYVLKKTIK